MDLKTCLKKEGMLFPDYNKLSIIDVVRTLYKYAGDNSNDNANPEIMNYIKNKKHIVLIVVDGMGSNLVDTFPNTYKLKQNKVTDLITVFPTTTGCVIPSIVTAQYPSVHGMIGWYNYYREKNISYYSLLFQDRINKKDLRMFDIKPQDIYKNDSKLNHLKREVVALLPKKTVDSTFSKFILQKNRKPYTTIEEAFEMTGINIQNNKESETFTYLYISEIDRKSHKYGVYSKEVRDVADQIEKGLRTLKDKKIEDLEIVIIADHGQIEVEEKEITMNFKKYGQYFYALPGIDYGTATYYVKKEKQQDFLNEFHKDHDGKMFIFKTEEFIKNDIFGKDSVSSYMNSNLGEYISFCKKGAYFVNSLEKQEKYEGGLKGTHSGFSKEEFIVPLIVI